MDVYEEFCSTLLQGFNDQKEQFTKSFEVLQNELRTLRGRASQVARLEKENAELRSLLKRNQSSAHMQHDWGIPPSIVPQASGSLSTSAQTAKIVAEIPHELEDLIQKTPKLLEHFEEKAAHYTRLEKAHLELLKKTRRLQYYIQTLKAYEDRLRPKKRRQRNSTREEIRPSNTENNRIAMSQNGRSRVKMMSVMDGTSSSNASTCSQQPNIATNNDFQALDDKDNIFLSCNPQSTKINVSPALLSKEMNSSDRLLRITRSTKTSKFDTGATEQLSTYENRPQVTLERPMGRKRGAICMNGERCGLQVSVQGTQKGLFHCKNGYTYDSHISDATLGLNVTTCNREDLAVIEGPILKPTKRRRLGKVSSDVGRQRTSEGRSSSVVEGGTSTLQSVLSQDQIFSVPSLFSSCRNEWSDARMSKSMRTLGLNASNWMSELELNAKNPQCASIQHATLPRFERRWQHNDRERDRRHECSNKGEILEEFPRQSADTNSHKAIPRDNTYPRPRAPDICDGLVHEDLLGCQTHSRSASQSNLLDLGTSEGVLCTSTKVLPSLEAKECEPSTSTDYKISQAREASRWWIYAESKGRLKNLLTNPPQDDTLLSANLVPIIGYREHYASPITSNFLKSREEGRYNSKEHKDVSNLATKLDTTAKEKVDHLNDRRSTANLASGREGTLTRVSSIPSRSMLLRDKPFQAISLEDFVINPNTNQGFNFAFKEAARNKNQRKCLSESLQLKYCGNKLGKLVQPGCLSNVVKGDTEEPQSDIAHLAHKHGQQQVRYTRAASPPGFWRADMPTTQEEHVDKELSLKLEQQKIAERYREAMCNGGRWIFKDERDGLALRCCEIIDF